MAVFYPVENLILKRPRRHFRTPISPIHWQLRSLIGVGANGVVYFPSGSGNLHLQRLDPNTLEIETIKLLSFSPRCLVAQNGWVCCGGETGEFTAMQVEDTNRGGGGGYDGGLNRTSSLGLGLGLGLGLDVDARLPLDRPSRQDDPVFSLLRRPGGNKPVVASSKKFGSERVNCITLWFPSPQLEPFHTARRVPVAVLANNDKHVTIVNLENMEGLDEIEYPDCVNRAVLSPDGRLLVAVGDDPYLYVHERVEKLDTPRRRLALPDDEREYTWHQVRRVHLRSQRINDTTDHRGSFAACFSNTGAYLAIGTQYGVISIFSTAALLNPDQDPMLTYFPSSGPHLERGAVREMAFSPGPFDLLAWSEDRGNIGVADIRSGFVARQILSITEADAYDHMEVTDKSAIDPRLLETRRDTSRLDRSDRGDSLGALGITNTLASSLSNQLDLGGLDSGSDASRRQRNRLDSLERYHFPLTGEETQVLEALQDHRRRREQRTTEQRLAEQRQRAAALEIVRAARPWATASRTQDTTSTTRGDTTESLRAIRERSASVTRAVNDLLSSSTQSRGDRIREAQRLAVEQRLATEQALAAERLRRDTPDSDSGTGTGSSVADRMSDRLLTDRASDRGSHWLAHRPPRFRVYTPRASGENGSATATGAATNNNDSNSSSSVSGSNNNNGALGSGPGAGSRTDSATTTGAMTTRERVISRLLASSQNAYSTWSDLDTLYLTADNPSLSDMRYPDEDATRHDRGHFWHALMNQLSGGDTGRDPTRRLGGIGLVPGPGPNDIPTPDETAGLAWSEDGSYLYIGAEDGIYELRVNITARKLSPSITLR